MTSIYIESADEITTVIERLRAAQDTAVALVAPRGATLLQSVVNLKLARKAAQDVGKDIVLVTTDKIGRNLGTQLGIPVASTEEEATKALQGAATTGGEDDVKVIAGVRIHNYYDEENDGGEDGASPDPIIIPKQMMKEDAPPAETGIAVPASVPEPPAEAEIVPTPAVETPKEPLPETPITRTAFIRNDTPPAVETIAANPDRPAKTRAKRESEPTTAAQKRIIKLSAYIGGVGLLIILTLAFLFLPITRVELMVHATDWNKELAFSASTDLTTTSADSTSLPAELLTATSDKTLTFKATGTKEVGDKATGTVTFSNNSTTNTLTVPTGTAITAAGQSFITTSAATVSGLTISGGKITPGTGQAPITANDPGPAGNLSNTLGDSVTVGKDSLSTVVNTSGGTSKTANVITSDDIAKAKSDLTQQLTDDAKQQLSNQAANRDLTFKQDADSLTFGDFTPTAKVGDQVDSADMHSTLTLTRTVVNTPTLDSAITDRLRDEQLANHNYQVVTKTIKVTSLSADNKILSLTVDLAGKEAAVIPQEELAKQLGGKSLAAGQTILSQAVPTATISITQRPSWWPVKRYPSINRYILLDVKYE